MKITQQAKKEAREYADQISKLSLMSKQNYTGMNQPDRYYIGYLGEWVFSRFLVEKGLRFQWHLNTLGKSDNGDFTIKDKKLDIKTASQGSYKYMMMPEKQLIHNRDYYIAVKIDNDNAEILGFAIKDDLVQTPTQDFGHGPTKAIKFEDLRNMEFLLGILK